nr:MAG TPA: hypothetical protein [Caudoviricetes sp.]
MTLFYCFFITRLFFIRYETQAAQMIIYVVICAAFFCCLNV